MRLRALDVDARFLLNCINAWQQDGLAVQEEEEAIARVREIQETLPVERAAGCPMNHSGRR